jgi:hypothetical protein
MSVNLIIKGPAKSAKRAAARYGVPLRVDRRKLRGSSDIIAFAPCSAERSIMTWFKQGETKRAGRGYAPGSLLHYNAFCAGEGERMPFKKSDLSGARRRRGRRPSR